MGIGDVTAVDGDLIGDCWYVDTGMYGVAGYGAAYLLGGERPTFVDTGIGTHHERVLALLEAAGVDPAEVAYICPTHVHLDHAGGAGFLAEACPNAQVAVHERGAPHLVDPERLVAGTKAAVEDQWRYYVEPKPVPADRIESLADGDRLDLGDRTLEAVAAPGHAHHQHVFHVPEAAAVFTADAAGIYDSSTDTVHPTTPPPEFDLEQCLEDVDRIRALAPSALLYPHFGPARAADRLDRYERVLREWVDAVEAVAASADSEAEAIEAVVEAHAPTGAWGEEKGRAEARLNARGVLGYLHR
ncbi:MAG: MBL fold metallo-hydrolase [Halobacteriota archaeon]